MGIIYNPNVEEKELYKAYNLTVYGKINRFEWGIYTARPTENCLITLRIADAAGNNVVDMSMGNNAILERNFKETIDNFLYWLKSEKPGKREIEEQIFDSLCKSNAIFNHQMQMRKTKERKVEEERKRAEEQQEKEIKNRAAVETYCKENGLFFSIGYEDVVIIKALTNESRSLLAKAQKQPERMNGYIAFMEKYPENNDARIIKKGTLEQILDWIERSDRK